MKMRTNIDFSRLVLFYRISKRVKVGHVFIRLFQYNIRNATSFLSHNLQIFLTTLSLKVNSCPILMGFKIRIVGKIKYFLRKKVLT